jgi:hypothetical protein
LSVSALAIGTWVDVQGGNEEKKVVVSMQSPSAAPQAIIDSA